MHRLRRTFWIAAVLLVSSVSSADSVSVSPRAAGFTTVAPLNIARSQHTATLLNNGQVLVVGGLADGNNTLNSTELYDPVANTWTLAASLNIARRQHTATLLPDGSVLVVGGMGDSGSVVSAEIYSVAANAWTSTAPLTNARQDHTATLLPNGKVLVAGGARFSPVGAGLSALTSCEIFDPSSNGWTPAPSMAKARYYHSAILLQNNKVLVASGAVSQTATAITTTPAAEIYDYVLNTWSSAGTLTRGRAQAMVVPITFQRVLDVAGINANIPLASAELYDSQLNAWTPTGALTTARTLHTVTLLNSGQVLAVAGFNGSDVINSAEIYDPVAASWSSAGTLAVARQYHTATLLQDGRVLIAGGINQIALASSEIYDLGAAGGPLTLNSTPTASPNPATIGQTVTFSASASGGVGALTYAWQFGDGASGSGASVTHAYAAAGTYGATVTVTDSAASSVSGSTSVTVAGTAPANAVGIGADDDGDGFSNVVEQTMGSSPSDPNSVPLGVTNAFAPLPLEVPQLRTKLVFNRGNRDAIHVVGLLPLPAGFVALGTKIGVDINGVPYLAILNARGASGSVFKLNFKSTHGVAPAQLAFFTVNLIGGTYSPALAQSGLKNGDFRRINVNVTVSILFNTKLYQTFKPQHYSARLDHYGTSSN